GFVGVGDSFGFSVDKEPGRSMVIDPVVVHSSTFVGGVYGEGAMGVGVDKEGNLVIASGTGS
ncbi:MAG: hypothetical protein GWN89_05050, partial [Thermoplasmata archaeon]|nr:hypothetical protein [Thermoplasmata archaeon]NIS11372.1 hypothetical protein [Thermoplasmata archaeon]NIS19310.1 hypothetical protein [Thermoplasmata archaeon]NIT76399.1 hypothetical protein [Thermoplasmata archaeon]NIU48438.1 hypothetical protein [Thermoplasmata archaeon]